MEWRQILPLLIPILALAIPVTAVVFNGLQKLARLRIEEARALQSAGHDGSGELEALREDVAQMREELSDVQERLDFAERALVQREARPRLPEQPAPE